MKPMKKTVFCALMMVNSILAQETNQAKRLPELAPTAEKTKSERVQFLLDVGEAYLRGKDFTLAKEAYERALQIDPANKQARFILSHVYISTKHYKDADNLLKELTKEYPTDFSIWNNLAWLYATSEDPNYRDGKKAVEYALEALTLAPDDYHVWSTLSEAYYVAGEYRKAYEAITTMATILTIRAKSSADITEESIKGYNDQIRKCKRAMDAYDSLQGIEMDKASDP